MPGCCAFECCNRTEYGKVLFCIPDGKNDVERRQIWLERIGRMGFSPSRNTRLCEDHFTADQFDIRAPGDKKRLRWDAVPSIFTHIRPPKQRKLLPAPSHSKPLTAQPEETKLVSTENMLVFLVAAHPMDVGEYGSACNHTVSFTGNKQCTEDGPSEVLNTEGKRPVVATSSELLTGQQTGHASMRSENVPLPLDATPLVKVEVPDYDSGSDLPSGNELCLEEYSNDTSIKVETVPVIIEESMLPPRYEDPADRLVSKATHTVFDTATRDALTERITALERRICLEGKKRRKAERENQRLKESLRRMLSDDQILVLGRGTPQGTAWSRETLIKAHGLRKAVGNKGYEYVRNEFNIPLPGARTLQRGIPDFQVSLEHEEGDPDEPDELSS